MVSGGRRCPEATECFLKGFELGFRPILYLVMLLVMVGITLFALGFIAELIVILIERLQEMVKISTNQLLDKKNTGIDE